MDITLEKIDYLRQLWKEKAWDKLDASISVADAMEGVFPDVSHFKIMAMANTDQQDRSHVLVDLLKARMHHLEHRTLYLTLLVDELMKLHRFDEAVDTLQALRTIYSDSPKLFEQMAHCAQQMGDDDLLEYAQGRFEFSIGKELGKRFRFEESVPYLKAAHGRAQADTRCSWLYGQALAVTGDYDSAKVTLEQYSGDAEHQQDIELMKLELALRQKDLITVKCIAENLLAVDPTHIDALRALACQQEWSGNLLGAVATCHTIVQHYPFDIPANLKAIHIAHHLVESQVGNLTPFTDQQRITIACVLMDGGFEEAGLKMLQGVKRSSADYEKARLLEIDHIIKNDNYREALTVLESELKSAPDNDEFLMRAAQCHYHLDDLERAEFLAEKASDINFNNFKNHFWLAESQYLQYARGKEMTTDQLEMIAALYDSYSQHYPRDGFPLERMAEIRCILQQYYLIKDCIIEARNRGHVSPRLSYLMGKYWQDMGDLKEAIDEFTHAIELNATGEFFWAHYERAQTALQNRNLPLAMQDARHLLSLWPDDADALALMESVNAAAGKKAGKKSVKSKLTTLADRFR